MPEPITILHQDRFLLFAEKPPRMLTTPAPKGKALDKGRPLLNRLAAEGHHVLAVHRLDYETSGVVLFAKDPATRDRLFQLFKEKAVHKSYEALCMGHFRRHSGSFDFPILDLGAQARVDERGDPACTRFEVLKEYRDCTLLRLFPTTGRHNQIRLHLSHAGHPIVGERKFARAREQRLKHKRVLLHATSLKLHPPHLDHSLRIRSSLAQDFSAFLENLPPASPGTPATKGARRHGTKRH